MRSLRPSLPIFLLVAAVLSCSGTSPQVSSLPPATCPDKPAPPTQVVQLPSNDCDLAGPPPRPDALRAWITSGRDTQTAQETNVTTKYTAQLERLYKFAHDHCSAHAAAPTSPTTATDAGVDAR